MDIIPEFTSAIVGFIFAQYLIPVTEKIADSIKESKNLFGRSYQMYYNTIGKYFFLTTKTNPALQNRSYEYKIFVQDNIATCYCSKVTDVRQNIFNVINGKIERVGISENYEVFFKGNINDNYFEWSETQDQSENKSKRIIHALYNTQGNPLNIVGSSVEISNRIITTPICILSRESIMYNTIDQLIDDTPQLKEMLNNVNLNKQILT